MNRLFGRRRKKRFAYVEDEEDASVVEPSGRMPGTETVGMHHRSAMHGATVVYELSQSGSGQEQEEQWEYRYEQDDEENHMDHKSNHHKAPKENVTSPSTYLSARSPGSTKSQSPQKSPAPKMHLTMKSTGSPPKAAVERWWVKPRTSSNRTGSNRIVPANHSTGNQSANHSPTSQPSNYSEGTAEDVSEKKISLSSLTGVMRASAAAAQSWWTWYKDSKTGSDTVDGPVEDTIPRLTKSNPTIPPTAVKDSRISETVSARERVDLQDRTSLDRQNLPQPPPKRERGVERQPPSPDRQSQLKAGIEASQPKQPLGNVPKPKLSTSPGPPSASRSFNNSESAISDPNQLKNVSPSPKLENEKSGRRDKHSHQKRSSQWPDEAAEQRRTVSPSGQKSEGKVRESPVIDSSGQPNGHGVIPRFEVTGPKDTAGKDLKNPSPKQKNAEFAEERGAARSKKKPPKSPGSNQIKRYPGKSPVPHTHTEKPSRSPKYSQVDQTFTKDSHRISRMTRQNTDNRVHEDQPQMTSSSLQGSPCKTPTIKLKNEDYVPKPQMRDESKSKSKKKAKRTERPGQPPPPVPNKSESKRKRRGSKHKGRGPSTSPNREPATKGIPAATKSPSGPKPENGTNEPCALVPTPTAPQRSRRGHKILAKDAGHHAQPKSPNPKGPPTKGLDGAPNVIGRKSAGAPLKAKSPNPKYSDNVEEEFVEYKNPYSKTAKVAVKSPKSASPNSNTKDLKSKSPRLGHLSPKSANIGTESPGCRSRKLKRPAPDIPIKSPRSSPGTNTPNSGKNKSRSRGRHILNIPQEDRSSIQKRHKSDGPEKKKDRHQKLVRKRSSSFPAGLSLPILSKDLAHGSFENLFKETKREIIGSMILGGKFGRGMEQEHKMLAGNFRPKTKSGSQPSMFS